MKPMLCPYGVPGDRLWVKEKHWICEVNGQGSGNPFLVYDEEFGGEYNEPRPKELRPWQGEFHRWGARPSIHMPRWASRTLLEVEAVRVERLQDISNGDAAEEGFSGPGSAQTPKGRFKGTWDSLYKPGSGFRWNDNPWVWVVEFEKGER